MCQQPSADGAVQPFCSARCQQLDLAGWFDGAYRIETQDSAGMSVSDDAHPSPNETDA
jgi:endogenous inhibitor of DNA gyrase (YacG/DUF329 family)